MPYFTIGTDCELFLKDAAGHHRSVCGLLGGTKEKPAEFKHLENTGFAYQEDNVAVEFNVPPSSTRENWLYNVHTGKTLVEQLVKKELGFSLSDKSSVSFDKKELSHPNALIFGCEPDYDAWKLVENKKPTSSDETLRTAGGHIHIGSTFDMVTGVQNMDLFLGVPSVLLDNSPESIKRRELYGKAGAMRPKPYGWEYRTLSNFWVFDEKLISWVYDAVYGALSYKHKPTKKEGKIIQDCINTGDTKQAENLVKHYGLIMP